ncbi:MAG TPA: FKBP-type peptidyl-prolyl cis-trans isomerase [Polyangiaceae bacterium]|nr:FKBP-type peptidyl-prolyl cis-trans isomerase [Polyangiaceae bacterium]
MTLKLRVARAFAMGMLGWWSTSCSVAAREREEAANAPAPASKPSVASEGSAPRGETRPVVEQTALGRRIPALPASAVAVPADAHRETCGSLSRRLAAGSGERLPGDDDRVILEYAMFGDSGEPLDGSAMHGEPIANSVRNLGPGLPCVVRRMRVGESRRVWVSAALQPPGEEGPRSVPARDLVLDITLQKLIRAPERPADYALPPPSAQHTASGLRFRFLQRGSGERHPVANSRVTISHSGWTNRGVLFASSALAGQPASFVGYELPTGLSEGIQLMRVGDKARFWLPQRLAYEGRSKNAPRGAVVFDVELLAID